MADNINDSDQRQVIGRTRAVGFYLLFIAGLIVAVGLALGTFMYLMSLMMGAGAGPSDPAEPARFVRNSLLFSGAIIGVGNLVGVLGLYRTCHPIKIRSR